MYLWKRFVKDRASKAAELPNPKFKNFLKIDEDVQGEAFDIYMKIKGSCKLYEDIIDVPLWIIIKLRELLKTEATIYEMIEACHILTGYSYKKLVKMRIHDIAKNYKFVINGLDKLADLEKNLIRKMEAKDEKAGASRLNKFSNLISIKKVAEYYNEKLEEAEKRPYKDCYSVWLLLKEQADVDIAYAKLNAPK